MAASSSRGRSSSPFSHRKPSSPYSSTSSSSSFINGKLIPRSCSSSATSFYGSGNAIGSRSMTPGRGRSDSMYSKGYGGRTSVDFPSPEELIGEPVDASRSGDSISVTIRFRPLSEREFQRGDEIAWYADGDKVVRNEYNPMNFYAFDRVFGESTDTQEVYEVAARPVVKTAMEGVNGTVFAYGVTSSGKTHTMHGDHNSPGIIPLAIKDVFSIIQDTPGREFLLRVSYLEIYNEVINDLLDPTGQNLRVREDAQGTYVEGIKEEVVLSPGHALSFIAAGEEHRHVGSNNFNLFSSRSHTIFTLMIESSAHGDEYDGVIFSQLNLIDLAGSESSKTETTGLRRKEGAYINKSLLTLGTVIGKLSEGKASHVPYRDSKLTRLLQSSLSGHGHVSVSVRRIPKYFSQEEKGSSCNKIDCSRFFFLFQLICTVTPASSNMEETHNTLKFASRAKRVEIYASRNKIIDEKSLIKKYQREISILKQELDQFKKGMFAGVHPEEIMSLKQKVVLAFLFPNPMLFSMMWRGVCNEVELEEGQVKMQSRLEEEEEAKAALMSRIQRLTKLILVSSKNTIPGCLGDLSSHQRRHSVGEDDKLDVLHDGTLLIDSMNQKDSPSSVSPTGSTITESTQAGELFAGSSCGLKPPTGGMTMSDQMDLLTEQVKMLAGEIAFSSSTLKRLVEQSVNDPESSKSQNSLSSMDVASRTIYVKMMCVFVPSSLPFPAQGQCKGSVLVVISVSTIQNMEREIQEKRRQMRALEQRIIESGEASVSNASFVDMQQTVMRLMTQCNEKAFELEIKSADNRILQEQLQNKCSENKDLLEKISLLEQQLALGNGDRSSPSSEQSGSEEYMDGLRKKIQVQEIESEKWKVEHIQILEENSGLRVQNDKLSEEASYAKELASAAAVELKNLAGEITKLSLQNAKLEKELLAARDLMNSRGGAGNRKYSSSDGIRPGRKGRPSGRSNDDFESWNLDIDDLKMELQARKQRELALEAALAEKEFVEEECRRNVEEAKRREAALENDLANMWVLVAQLKKDAAGSIPQLNNNERHNGGTDHACDPKMDISDGINPLKESQLLDVTKPAQDIPKEEPLVARLKARMQEMKEKELMHPPNGDVNSHCVNLVHLHVLSALCVAQRLQIEFLLLPLDNEHIPSIRSKGHTHHSPGVVIFRAIELTGFGSHENSEVKRAWTREIPGWVTPWEASRELPETKP
ncbi:hypothetical protein LguiB_007235 [Lonicera macranthoides]